MCNALAAISPIIFSSGTNMRPPRLVVMGIDLRLIGVGVLIQFVGR
jgi:hypothetical protein